MNCPLTVALFLMRVASVSLIFSEIGKPLVHIDGGSARGGFAPQCISCGF